MPSEILHASAVALGNRAALLLGPSGSGKSGLALELMGLGATLVADDRVELSAEDDGPPRARPPAALAGRIEARGIGILGAEHASGIPVALAADLGRASAARLPPSQTIQLLGAAVPLIWVKDAPHLAPAILQILKGNIEAHG